MELNKIYLGDCLEVLKTFPDNSVDSIVTDPPAGISFMGKEWDSDKGGRDNWIKWMSEIAKECLRVIKPGGHCLVWSIPRTSHWTATAWENAGFEVRDNIAHVFGSGFPKSYNIGKAIDQIQGNEREVVGFQRRGESVNTDFMSGGNNITKGNSEWEGWGTALKPAREDWWLLRKPLSEKTIAENVLKWRTGGINIDESRIGTTTETHSKSSESAKGKGIFGEYGEVKTEVKDYGRFPANFIHDGSDEVLELFPESKSQGHWSKTKTIGFGEFGNGHSEYLGVGEKDKVGGSASRFFYCAKASKSERNEGLDDMPYAKRIDYGGFHSEKGLIENGRNPENRVPMKNGHPTVKPVKLMQYLVRLVTPKGGIVLDPFIGSGTTGMACKKLGFNYVGIEMNEEYLKIAEARIEAINKGGGE